MINITIVYPTDPFGRKIGGIETFLKGFVSHAPDDFRITMLGTTVDPVRRPEGRWQRVKLRNKRFDFFPVIRERLQNIRSRVPLTLKFTLALGRKLSHLPVDRGLFLFHRIEPALLFRARLGSKLAIVHHDVEGQIREGKSEVMWRRFPGLYFWLERLLIPGMTHVYTNSKRTLEFYRSKFKGGEKKFEYLPQFVDEEVFSFPIESKQGLRQLLGRKNPMLDPHKKWILFVGRLQPVKAPFRLIDILLKVRASLETQLIVIGEGNLKSKVQAYARDRGGAGDVQFLGDLPQAEIADFYGASDVLLLASDSEGTPTCVLESLRCGTPVVSTKVGEIESMVVHGVSGEIVDSFDPGQIARGVLKVLGLPSRYSDLNCERAVQAYKAKRVLEPVYEKIRGLDKINDRGQRDHHLHGRIPARG